MTISGSVPPEMDEDLLSEDLFLTEVTCTLQDYMSAWVEYTSDLQRKYSYDECLLEVIKKRVVFIQENIQ